MPTIQFKKKDLESLLKRPFQLEQIEQYLPWVKGEIKDYDPDTDELRIELNDTNRPDLWCVEGIARQIRQKLAKKPVKPYPFKSPTRSPHQIHVDPELKEIRPFIGGCLSKGLSASEGLLEQFIQTQEKLADLYGRKRHTLSIGLYRLENISFPVEYVVVNPSEVSFIPLNATDPMTLQEILRDHPKGKEYGDILKGASRVPLLRDRREQILSFPPIINSRDLGEVRPGDKDLLVEVTGTDLRMVLLAVNIWAANLRDRGAEIEPIEILYPWKTVFGRKVRMPSGPLSSVSVTLDDVTNALGQEIKGKEILELLNGFGHSVKQKGKTLTVVPPCYRDDLLHPVDVIEEVAISKGYDRFTPLLPDQYTVGELSPLEQFSDRVRSALIGMGFQEMNSNVLYAREEIVSRMGSDGRRVVEVDNVMAETFAVLRDSIFPSLLKVEASSSKAFYPHRIFEAGEVVMKADGKDPQTRVHLGVLLAHPEANFSEIHTFLEMLFYYLNMTYDLKPVSHPSFLEGRAGEIGVQGKTVGLIGEFHPEVLERWQIAVPCSGIEVFLDDLLNLKSS